MAPNTRSKSVKNIIPSTNIPSMSTGGIRKSKAKPRISKSKAAELSRTANKTVKDPVFSREQGVHHAPPFPSSSRASRNLLLDLPAELRSEVYGYVLGGHAIAMNDQGLAYKISSHSGPKFTTKQGRSARALKKHFLSLLLICRQVYTEAHLVPYATCSFVLPDPHTLAEWTDRRTSAQQQCITSLDFHLEKWYPITEPQSWGRFDTDNDTWSMQPTVFKTLDNFGSLKKIEIKAITKNNYRGREARLRSVHEKIRER